LEQSLHKVLAQQVFVRGHFCIHLSVEKFQHPLLFALMRFNQVPVMA
jgi:hypothetical protein